MNTWHDGAVTEINLHFVGCLRFINPFTCYTFKKCPSPTYSGFLSAQFSLFPFPFLPFAFIFLFFWPPFILYSFFLHLGSSSSLLQDLCIIYEPVHERLSERPLRTLINFAHYISWFNWNPFWWMALKVHHPHLSPALHILAMWLRVWSKSLPGQPKAITVFGSWAEYLFGIIMDHYGPTSVLISRVHKW